MINALVDRELNGIYEPEEAHRYVENGENGAVAPDSDWDILGDDLWVAPLSEIQANIRSRVSLLQARALANELRRNDIDRHLLEQADYARRQLASKLESFTQEQRDIADSVQTWVIDQLGIREAVRGEVYRQSSPESYLENIAVLDVLQTNLTADLQSGQLATDESAELQQASRYVQLWREDMFAELDRANIKQLYAVAH